jgi:hypothetical protein
MATLNSRVQTSETQENTARQELYLEELGIHNREVGDYSRRIQTESLTDPDHILLTS